LAFLGMSEGQMPAAPSLWVQPAADLTGQIADILGPGQAQLTIRNLSSIQTVEVAAIRKLLEQDLKTRGVLVSGIESANAIHVTLSENSRERLWVAEVVEGSDRRVAMVHVDASSAPAMAADSRMVLRQEKISGISSAARENPILAAAEINGHFVVIFADRIAIFSESAGGWTEANAFILEKPIGRDPRGFLLANADGGSFTAHAPGTGCTASYSLPLNGTHGDSGWSVRCLPSDDPWPVYQSGDARGMPSLRAFYNPARNFFTGTITPSVGIDLPPFYTAGMIPRAAGGAALLLAGIDGKVSMVENGVMHSVTGTRDWGSDFAVVRSGCGAGTQVIASSSGEAPNDSLRAFEIPALEAIPASSPMATDGTVTALWTAQDGKSVFAVVRNLAGAYEVDRVTSLCN
jgi:hypothetical protein